MARPKKPEGQARTNTLRIRLTPAEREAIERAVPPGLEVSSWARAMLLELAAAASKGRRKP
jgi:hypothetical protein